MALVFSDRVKETTTTTGTGDLALGGAATGYRSFSTQLAVNDTCHYCVYDDNGNWEIGLGTLTAATTFERTTVHSSSNANAAVSFAAGAKSVFITVSEAAFTDLVDGIAAITNLPTNLVYETTLTAAVQTISLPDDTLDINTVGAYEIHFNVVSNTATTADVVMYVDNGSNVLHTTTANYTTRYIAGGAYTVTTNAVARPYILETGTSIGFTGYSVCKLSLVNSHAVFLTQYVQALNTKVARLQTYLSDTSTNIKKLQFTSSGIYFGIGTKVRVFKGRW